MKKISELFDGDFPGVLDGLMGAVGFGVCVFKFPDDVLSVAFVSEFVSLREKKIDVA